jgi:hypothetical protein
MFFPHYLTNGTIFGKHLKSFIELKLCVLIFWRKKDDLKNWTRLMLPCIRTSQCGLCKNSSELCRSKRELHEELGFARTGVNSVVQKRKLHEEPGFARTVVNSVVQKENCMRSRALQEL